MAVVVIVLLIAVGAASFFAGEGNAGLVTTTTTQVSTTTRTAGAQTITSTSTLTLLQFSAGPISPANVPTRLIIDTGKMQSFYAGNGLSPSWLYPPFTYSYQNYPSMVGNGTQIGFTAAPDALIARSLGLPIKIVGTYVGPSSANGFYALSSGQVKTAQDLAGKTVGVAALNTAAAVYHTTAYFTNVTGIKYNAVIEGNETNALAALRAGKVDAVYVNAGTSTYAAVSTGELKLVESSTQFIPSPSVGIAIWATDSLIQQNPAMVKAFVKATLASAAYLQQNPTYATNLIVQDFGVTPPVASAIYAASTWTPAGTGTGTDLVAAVTNAWTLQKATGLIPANANPNPDIKAAVDLSFLGP